MMHIRIFALGIGIAAVLLLTPLAFQSAEAAARAAPSLQLSSPHLTEEADAVVLSALLSDPAGEAIAGERITFFVDVAFEDAEPMEIGSRGTDATGRATVTYRPTWDGEHRLTARFDGSSTYLPASTAWSMELLGADRPYVERPLALERVRDWLPMTVGTMVLVVWFLLASITAGTVIGIVRQGSGLGSTE